VEGFRIPCRIFVLALLRYNKNNSFRFSANVRIVHKYQQRPSQRFRKQGTDYLGLVLPWKLTAGIADFVFAVRMIDRWLT